MRNVHFQWKYITDSSLRVKLKRKWDWTNRVPPRHRVGTVPTVPARSFLYDFGSFSSSFCITPPTAASDFNLYFGLFMFRILSYLESWLRPVKREVVCDGPSWRERQSQISLMITNKNPIFFLVLSVILDLRVFTRMSFCFVHFISFCSSYISKMQNARLSGSLGGNHTANNINLAKGKY